MLGWMKHDLEPEADSQPAERTGSIERMSDEALMECGICPVCHVSFEGEPDSCSSCGSSLPPEFNVARFSAPDPDYLKNLGTGMAILLGGSALGLGSLIAIVVVMALFPAWKRTTCMVGSALCLVIIQGTFHMLSKANVQLERKDRDEPKQVESEDL